MLAMDEMIFLAKNPWRQGRSPEPPKLKRSLFEPFERDLRRPEILLLLGARQTGKTTLLIEMARRAVSSGLCLPENLYYFDLDTMRCQDVLASNRSLLDFLKIQPGDMKKTRTLVLIDEIQRLENPSLFLKSVYDLHLPIKLVATGSSTLEIRSRVRESLAGRSLRHFLWPLAPEECRGTPFEELETYLRLGGFPSVVLEDDEARRQTVLANLLAAYLDRDIVEFLRVENIQRFTAFLQLLAGQVGQLVNLNEMANTLAVSRDTLSRYLSYLESTFMVRSLRPYVGNRRGELTKMPKVYFADLGFRNLLAGRLTGRLAPADRGPLIENLVEILLRLDPRTESLFFWRTRSGAEVDFVWSVRGGDLLAVEVKGSFLSRPSVPRSLAAFVKTYRPKRAALVAPGATGRPECAGPAILFLPPERVTSLAGPP